MLRLRLGKSVKTKDRPVSSSPVPLDEENFETIVEEEEPIAEEEPKPVSSFSDNQADSDNESIYNSAPDDEIRLEETNNRKISTMRETKPEPNGKPKPHVINISVNDLYGQTYTLPKGNYIIVGAFTDRSNAIAHKKTLLSLNMSNKIIWIPSKQLFYIYSGVEQTESNTQKKLKAVKDKTGIEAAWIFRVSEE